MYNYKKPRPTSLKINTSLQGETIEEKIERIVNNNEPITDSAPLIYSERKDGVNPAYDIRTDRWEIAIDGMNRVQKSKQAAREEKGQKKEDAKIIDLKNEKPKESGGVGGE